LAVQALVDPEELPGERFPDFPGDAQIAPWMAFHLPMLAPRGHPIARGPVAHTVRECLTIVGAGEAVIMMGARAASYYAAPGLKFVDIDLPPIPTALVWRRSDPRQAIFDLDECASTVAKIHINGSES
jgi:LysR family transcriptional regulator, benzoate and cis,cis-muconate-responsive activator of ben and cat genes